MSKTAEVNEKIRARRIVLIDEEGRNLGQFVTRDAISLANERGLDLVQVNHGDVPVCKIMDYGKYLYNMKKRQKNARSSVVKISPRLFSLENRRHTSKNSSLGTLACPAILFLASWYFAVGIYANVL